MYCHVFFRSTVYIATLRSLLIGSPHTFFSNKSACCTRVAIRQQTFSKALINDHQQACSYTCFLLARTLDQPAVKSTNLARQTAVTEVSSADHTESDQ